MYLEAGSNNYVIIVVSKFMTYLHVSRVSLFPQLIKQSNKRRKGRSMTQKKETRDMKCDWWSTSYFINIMAYCP